MVASWGGYSFIINIIPIYVVFLIKRAIYKKMGLMLIDRFNSKVYVAYSIFYVLGTIFAIQVF